MDGNDSTPCYPLGRCKRQTANDVVESTLIRSPFELIVQTVTATTTETTGIPSIVWDSSVAQSTLWIQMELWHAHSPEFSRKFCDHAIVVEDNEKH